MQGRSNRGSRIIGRTGPLSEGGTASISGPTLRHWSSPMAPTAGLGSSWTGSWPPCTPAGVQRGAQTALVQETHYKRTQHTSPALSLPLINLPFSLHLPPRPFVYMPIFSVILSPSSSTMSSLLFYLILPFCSFAFPFSCIFHFLPPLPFLFSTLFFPPSPVPSSLFVQSPAVSSWRSCSEQGVR